MLKRSGVVFPSYGREAVWTSPNAFAADFPVSNLALLDRSRNVALRSATGETIIDFVLPVARVVDFVGLVHHNGEAAATCAVQLSSGTNPTTNLVHQSGVVPLWGSALPVAGYLALRPYRLDAPVTVRSGRITLAANSAPWEIGAVEIGEFWSWLDVGVEREIGIESQSILSQGAAGADHITRQWGARIATGQRKVVDQSELDTRLVDFHRFTGMSRAFVWCWDVDDAATWPREAWLARNKSLPGGVANDFEAGSLRYDFREHLG